VTKLKEEVEDLCWKLEHEQKVAEQVREALENRISSTLAENNTLKKANLEAKNDQEALEAEITTHQDEIKKLKETITQHKIAEQKLGFEKDKLADDVVKLVEH
jgi:chromosome segregation ATPase